MSADLRFAEAWTGTGALVFGRAAAAPEVTPFDDVVFQRADVFQMAEPAGRVCSDGAQDTAAVDQSVLAGHSVCVPVTAPARTAWSVAAGMAAAGREAYQHARPVAGAPRDAWACSLARVASGPDRYSLAMPIRVAHAERVQLAAVARLDLLVRIVGARPAGVVVASRYSAARPASRRIAARWQHAMPPGAGTWRPDPVTPPVVPLHPLVLRFSGRLDHTTRLVFGVQIPAPVVIPILRAYIVINEASLLRTSNNLVLPANSFSVSIDADSSQWTWSASLPLGARADLEPDAPGEPVDLLATANGSTWLLRLSRIREQEQFGSGSLSIGGTGIAAEIAAPAYAAVSTDNVAGSATAQQLAAAALMFNGVSLGWALDWQAADWLIPAGVWVHTGTPLEAVARIAEAAGAYVQAAPASRTLRVLPRYPVAPWAWADASPAVVLPAAAVLERGTEMVVRPDYDVVYVQGEQQGIRARVLRTGSAGDKPAQPIVDRLITHQDAARGRGLAALGNTGVQRLLTLETGVLPTPGVIHVGTLIDWTRGATTMRGLVRSLSVSATAGQGRDPVRVRQSLGVECHG